MSATEHGHREAYLSEHERWEGRYAVPDYIFGKAPNVFLASCKKLLPRSGNAIAVADGEGRNGVWLAEQGLDVLSLDFSQAAQSKAAALAKERNVKLTLVHADVHTWAYPEAAFDVVAEIFTQFSSPKERAGQVGRHAKDIEAGWPPDHPGLRPKQLQYGTGGPKEIENLYTRPMLEEAFHGFRDVSITEEEREMHEGTAHGGMSAVINLTARK